MTAPIFIVGCPRSGTSFLYHLLLSAGGFAAFHTQMNAFDVLEPVYGDLSSPKNKRRMMDDWLESKAFYASGLDRRAIEARIMSECTDASSFLRIVMAEVTRKQGVDRWVDSTPTNAPHMPRIARDFSAALFVHIIRDGRDVALSLDKRGWSRPLPWDTSRSLLAAGLYWKWIVRKTRRYGARLGSRYLEVRYEDLVENPQPTLARLADFIQHDLSYERIQKTSVGSVKTPLTSFDEDLRDGKFSPVGRWKTKFHPKQLAWFEALAGDYLRELGYPLVTDGRRAPAIPVYVLRMEYAAFYEIKQWIKINTGISRWMVNYSEILFDK